MRISKCYIAGFGRIKDFKYEFKDGFNIILEENGWGKTTFSIFLKSMFYGLEYSPNRRKALTERRHYMPWDGGVFGGSLEFYTDKKGYRIEREFGRTDKEDTLKLINLETGRECDDFKDPIGEELFGVDRESFEKSIFIAQSSMETGITDRINTKVGNLSETKDDIDVFEAAGERIEDTRKIYMRSGRINPGKLIEIRERIRDGKKNAEDIPSLEAAYTLQKEIMDDRIQTIEALKKDKEKLQKEISEQGKSAQTLGALKEKKEQYEKTLKTIEELDAFFSKGIPEGDTISEIENDIQTLSVDKRSLNAKERESIEDEEAARLEKLFISGIPDVDELNRWQNQADRLKELRMKRESSRLTTDDEKELKNLKEFFIKGRPTHEAITEILKKEGQIHALEGEEDALDKNREKLNTERIRIKKREEEKERGAGYFFVIMILLLLAAAGVFMFVIKGNEGHLIGASAAGAAGFMLVIDILRIFGEFSKKKGRALRMDIEENEISERLTELEEEKDTVRRGIEDFLNLYMTQNKVGLMDRIAEVQRKLDRLEHLEKLDGDLMNKNSEALEELSEKQLALYTALHDYADNYGMDLFHEMSEQRLLKQLFSDREREVSRRKLQGDLGLLQNRIQGTENNVIRFLDSYPFDEKNSNYTRDDYAGRISIIKSNKERVETLEKNAALLSEEMKKLTEELPNDGKEAETDIDELQNRAFKIDESLTENMNYLQKDKETLSDTSEKLINRQEEKDRTEVLEEKEKLLSYRVEILSKAKNYLQEARDKFMARYMEPLQKGMEHYMSLIYPNISNAPQKGTFELDLDLNIRFRSNGKTVESEYLSEGYQDMAALSVRLALIDAMYDKEQPTVIMDDPFAGLDKEKVESGLDLMDKLGEKRQIIYFTCHPSRAK
ncbi:MAG: AAA family ATPase [Lachnospiraceae bacterium]|jgi:uncharacterized protein YhaN|nr:AAA family ATPase [Lachnospiraceae bacterium]